MEYTFHSMHDYPELRKAFGEIDRTVWPDYMGWDDVFSNDDVAFPEYHFVLTENDIPIGIIGSVPFFLDRPVEDLPEEGFDWMLMKGVNDYKAGIKPDSLGGLQVTLLKEHQGKGLSSLMVKEMISFSRRKQFTKLVIPVRPSLKSDFPHESIEDYLRRKTVDGLPFDPWLRVHVRLGGQIIKPCNKAMCLHNSIAEWQKFSDVKIARSGEYIIDGALSPVLMNVENDEGKYTEPNVWVVHEISE